MSAECLTRVGYVVLVPERRGYGKIRRRDLVERSRQRSIEIDLPAASRNRRRARRNPIICVVYRCRFETPRRDGLVVWGRRQHVGCGPGPAFLAAVDQAAAP